MTRQNAITKLVADVATAIAAQELGRRMVIPAQAGTTPAGWQQLTLDLAALAPMTQQTACPLCGGHLTGAVCDRCGMEVDL